MCSVEHCNKKVVAKGLCENHYRRMKRNGSPLIYKYQPSGGLVERADGYYYITHNGKQVMYHRLLMAQHLGRELTADEVVHHKDRNRKNNKLDNLQLMTKVEHSSLHASERRHKRRTVQVS